MNNLALVLGIIGGGIGIVSALVGALAWYSANVQKRYASQRDFEHLKNNQKVISQSVADIDKELEEINQTLKTLLILAGNIPEMKAYLLARLPESTIGKQGQQQ